MANTNQSFIQRLNSIFRSGPSIQRRVKGHSQKPNNSLMQGNYGYKSTSPFGFGKDNRSLGLMGQYNLIDRLYRYSEYQTMQVATPEVARALDIIAEETVGGDDRGKCFHIYSKNTKIKAALEELYYDTMNIEFNLKPWVRNLAMYGDLFLFNEVLPDIGIVNVMPLKVNEIEREENFDPEDPYAIRFKWTSRGNKYLENWQIAHFRLLGNDAYMPYGVSCLESARAIWNQLIMYEDAMLTYRIVRSPERRVFYIDVAHVPAGEVSNYLEAVKSALRSRGNIDRTTGKEDLRHNASGMLDDYFLPVRGDKTGTKIDTLSGGQHITATEDVEYIQAKLFTALQVPKPYLNYMENMGAKASLSQLDVRFSRTINSFQKIVLSELNKLAMIHLLAKGFDGPDLIDFELKLSNPSSVALQQKLELWTVKFDLAGSAKETRLVDENWIQKNILELSTDEISEINKGLKVDRLRDIDLESLEPVEPDLSKQPKTLDSFNPITHQQVGENIPKNPAELNNQRSGISLDNNDQEDDEENDIDYDNSDKIDSNLPVHATPFLNRHKRNRVRREGEGRGTFNTAMPDTAAMLSPKNKYTKDIYGQKTESFDLTRLKEIEKDVDHRLMIEPTFGKEINSILERLKTHIKTKKSNKVLLEDLDLDIEIELNDEEHSSTLENKILTEVFQNDLSDENIIKEKTLKDILNDEEDNL